MKHNLIPVSRPRVYLTDFELAIMFPMDSTFEERLCVGPPLGGSIPDYNARPMPPEVLSGKPYDPFKLDVWQLGTTFSDFKVCCFGVSHATTSQLTLCWLRAASLRSIPFLSR